MAPLHVGPEIRATGHQARISRIIGQRGGRVRMTLVHNFDALGVDHRFVTALIPIEGSEEAGKGPRTTLSARPSRFFFRPLRGAALGSVVSSDEVACAFFFVFTWLGVFRRLVGTAFKM